jgi:hypothetical protein
MVLVILEDKIRMLRSLALFTTLLLSSSNASLAETIKRDIYGFRTGLPTKDQQAAVTAHKCKLWTNGGASAPLSPKVFASGEFCEGANSSVSVFFRAGPYSKKVLDLWTNVSVEVPVAQAVRDICLQFKTDCSSAALDTPMDLGDGLFLQVQRDPPFGLAVHLIDRSLITEEEKLAPPPRGVPKL